MTAYAFATGRFEGDNGCKATLQTVKLDFRQDMKAVADGDSTVVVALDDGELHITGTAQRINVEEGDLTEYGKVYFETTTSNFGVYQKVTIKLNRCRFTGNAFEALPDSCGNVFTLSTENK